MKLMEIAPDFLRSQIGTLLTILQHLEATQSQSQSGGPQSATIPMISVVKLMNNTGIPFSYEDFKQLYDTEPRIKELVANFNQDQITIGQPEPNVGTNTDNGEETVDRMAQKAAKSINQTS
jgi:hypothetical protein